VLQILGELVLEVRELRRGEGGKLDLGTEVSWVMGRGRGVGGGGGWRSEGMGETTGLRLGGRGFTGGRGHFPVRYGLFLTSKVLDCVPIHFTLTLL